jgi:hypothetical protein
MELGYVFTPLPYPGHPGYNSLTVNIHENPTLHHFDPEQVRVQVWGDKKGLSTLVIGWSWLEAERVEYIPGIIRLNDRIGRDIQAFSFGGSVKITPAKNWNEVVFNSPVPIFVKSEINALGTFIAIEFEILLAERRAAWINNPEQFEDRLRSVDPGRLYIYCLHELLNRYHCIHQDQSQIENFCHFLRTEIHRLKHTNSGDVLDGDLSKYL